MLVAFDFPDANVSSEQRHMTVVPQQQLFVLNSEFMLTSSGPNLVSWGAVMGAWIEKAGDGQTKLTVVTKRRITVNLATTLTESTFQKRFAQAVEIVKRGEPLPRIAPK